MRNLFIFLIGLLSVHNCHGQPSNVTFSTDTLKAEYIKPLNGILHITFPNGNSVGTVTSVGFTNANGVSGSVSNLSTTPNLTISLDTVNKYKTHAQSNADTTKLHNEIFLRLTISDTGTIVATPYWVYTHTGDDSTLMLSVHQAKITYQHLLGYTPENVANKGATNGYASLVNGLVPLGQIPALVINNTYVDASEAAMISGTRDVGDISVRTDSSETFILKQPPSSSRGNWVKLLSNYTEIGIPPLVSGDYLTNNGTSLNWAPGSGGGGTNPTVTGINYWTQPTGYTLTYAVNGTHDTLLAINGNGKLLTGITPLQIGLYALTQSSGNSYNEYLGYYALSSNTSGINNIAIGHNTLIINTTGNNNTGVGNNAFYNLTTGSNNTAIGYGSLYQNHTGSNNTAIGLGAGSNNTGSGNVFIGDSAGFSGTGNNKLIISTSTKYNLISGDLVADSLTFLGNIKATKTLIKINNDTAMTAALWRAGQYGARGSGGGSMTWPSGTAGFYPYNGSSGYGSQYFTSGLSDSLLLTRAGTAKNITLSGVTTFSGSVSGFTPSMIGLNISTGVNTSSNCYGGYGSLQNTNNSLSSNNTAWGLGTLYSLTNGTNDAAFGYFALANVIHGSNDLGLGNYAGFNETRSNRIYIGNIQQPSLQKDSTCTPVYIVTSKVPASIVGQVVTLNADSINLNTPTLLQNGSHISGQMTFVQLMDTLSIQQALPGTFKIPLKKLSTTLNPYTLSSSITLVPDTLNSKAGNTTQVQLKLDGVHTVSWAGGFIPGSGSRLVDSTLLGTANQIYTYLIVCWGSGTNKFFTYTLQTPVNVTVATTYSPTFTGAPTGITWIQLGTATRVSANSFTISNSTSIIPYIAKGVILRWTKNTSQRCAMVSIPTTGSNPYTVTFVGDTMNTSPDAGSMYYTTIGTEQFTAKFVYAGTIGSTGTDVTNDYYATESMRVLGAEMEAGTAGTTNSTSVTLINGTGSVNLCSTISLGSGVAYSSAPNSTLADYSLALGDRVSLNITAVQSTPAVDLYVQLYLFPTRYLNLP